MVEGFKESKHENVKSLLIAHVGYEDVAAGAITTTFSARSLESFDDYVTSLTPTNRTSYPWIGEYWKDVFDCDLPGEDY